MCDKRSYKYVISFDALYESMIKCRKNVGWKDSVAHFYLNGVEECLKLEEQLNNGKYKPRKQTKVYITHPKPREAISVSFRDRVYQRSLNDNAIYPEIAKHLIYANCACQKGKGTDFAMDLLDRYLKEGFRKFGKELWILQCDIKGYYPNMNHEVAEKCFEKYLNNDIFIHAREILRNQYSGDVGYNPGSQMVQIVGISVLNSIDHYIKEVLGVKWYLRYMDDFILIHHDKKYLENCYEEIKEKLNKMKFEFNIKKTNIYNINCGIKFLGFTHYLTDSGKVIRIILNKNVKAEKKKLYRMSKKVKNGEMTKEKVDSCYVSWKAHALRGNSFKLLQRMDEYYDNLWKGCVL